MVSRVGDVVSTAPLRVMLREDYERSFRSWHRPGLHAIVVYRIGRWAMTQPQPVRFLATAFHRVLNTFLIRNVYGTELSVDAVLGRRVLIGHHQGVQIPAFCIIGDDSLVRHNVTIGFGATDADPLAVPHLGRNVKLGSGSVLMGPIGIGDDVIVGPNSVIQANVPAGTVTFVPPARMLKPKSVVAREAPVNGVPTRASEPTEPAGTASPGA